MNSIPPSESVDVSKLAGLFRDTTASYKFFFFLALVRRADQNVIRLRDLAADMVLDAWFPAKFCRLSLGTQDSLAEEVGRIDWGPIRGSWISSQGTEWARLRGVAEDQVNHRMLMRFVPFRLLRPFFAQETRGLPDQGVNEAVAELSRTKVESNRPLYVFSQDREVISLEHHWQRYLVSHRSILEDWTKYHLAIFLQTKNPSVPGILEKLVPSPARATLEAQTQYWKRVQKRNPLACPYSGEPLSGGFSLDHCIPWSFVGHDRIWNLVPVLPVVNSSKGDRIPDPKLVGKVIDLQVQGLEATRSLLGNGPEWTKATEAFVLDLRLSPADLLDRDCLTRSLSTNFSALSELASRQGFGSGWTWAGRI